MKLFCKHWTIKTDKDCYKDCNSFVNVSGALFVANKVRCNFVSLSCAQQHAYLEQWWILMHKCGRSSIRSLFYFKFGQGNVITNSGVNKSSKRNETRNKKRIEQKQIIQSAHSTMIASSSRKCSRLRYGHGNYEREEKKRKNNTPASLAKWNEGDSNIETQ